MAQTTTIYLNVQTNAFELADTHREGLIIPLLTKDSNGNLYHLEKDPKTLKVHARKVPRDLYC